MIDSRKLSDLSAPAQIACQKHLAEAKRRGANPLVIQTLRDAEFQATKYAEGRTKPGVPCKCGGKSNPVGSCKTHPLGLTVTNCDGYRNKSRHQSGRAWDMVATDASGKILWDDSKAQAVIADAAKAVGGIVCGADWKIHDTPHFEVEA